jgi:hypothetical protein
VLSVVGGAFESMDRKSIAKESIENEKFVR